MKGTKCYFVGFFTGHVVTVLVLLIFLSIAFSNWFFAPEPAWFSALTLIALLVPYLLGGAVAQIKCRQRLTDTWRALLVLVGVATIACVLLRLWNNPIYFIVLMPSSITLSLMTDNNGLGVSQFAAYLAGALLAPVLYHIGWHMAGIKKKPDEG